MHYASANDDFGDADTWYEDGLPIYRKAHGPFSSLATVSMRAHGLATGILARDLCLTIAITRRESSRFAQRMDFEDASSSCVVRLRACLIQRAAQSPQAETARLHSSRSRPLLSSATWEPCG